MQTKTFEDIPAEFLKGSALTAGASWSLGLLDFRSWAKTNADAPVTRVPTSATAAGTVAPFLPIVKNGRIWKIEGNPEANGNRGSGLSQGPRLSSRPVQPRPDPLPLKRVDGKFQPISWEQAYKEIAQKINLILMDNGPESVFWVNYPQSNHAYALRLMHSLGSPHYFTHGSTCYTARNAAWNFTVGKLPSNDLANSRYIMIIGRNPAGGIDLGQVKDIVKAKEKGAKVVVVDPRHSETAILADEWLPIKPGTDLALLLAMINVMVKEKLYDRSSSKTTPWASNSSSDEIINYPPEWAEKICEIPAATIVRIAREMAARETPGPPPPRLSRRVRGPVPEQLSDGPRPGHRQRSSGEYQPGRGHLFSRIGRPRGTAAHPSGPGRPVGSKGRRNGHTGKISPRVLRRRDRPRHPRAGPAGGVEGRFRLPP